MAHPRQDLSAPRDDEMTQAELGLLGLVIVIGAVVRSLRMGESLWYDEIAAWIGYGVHGPRFIVSTFHDPSNHVLHTLLSWCSVVVTENWLAVEWQLRMPAFLASLGAIWAVHALARRTAGREAAIFAALLMAIWPVCVLEGVEARGYSLMMLFSALASLQLLVSIEKRTIWSWALYALWCALGVWAHMVTVIVAIGHGVWLATQLRHGHHRRAAIAGFVALGVAAALSIALYAPMLGDMLGQRDVIAAGSANQPTLFGAEGLHLLLQLGGAWLWYAALPGLVLCALGFGALVYQGNARAWSAMTFTLLGLPLLVAAVALLGTWVYARFALFTIPGAALVAAIGWNWLRERSPWVAIVAGFLVIAAAAADLTTRPPKQPLRESVEYMLDHDGEGARVLVVSIAHSVLDVYIKGAMTSYNLGENLDTELDQFRPRFVIMLYPDRVDASRFAFLEARGYVERVRFDGWVDWGHGDVVVFEKSTSQQINKST